MAWNPVRFGIARRDEARCGAVWSGLAGNKAWRGQPRCGMTRRGAYQSWHGKEHGAVVPVKAGWGVVR